MKSLFPKSRMREIRTSGSVGGRLGDGAVYPIGRLNWWRMPPVVTGKCGETRRTHVAGGRRRVWTGVFVAGSVHEGRVLRAQIETFGTLAARAMSDNGITEADTDAQSVTLETGTQLVDTGSAWGVEFEREETDEDYARFYFRNADTGLLHGTYVVKTDDDGNPVRGLFAYVNPSLLSDAATGGKRLVAFAFDLTDAGRNLFVLRETYYHDLQAVYVTYHLHQQCDTDSGDCLGEYMELSSAATRVINDGNNLRFAWNDGTGEVCLAEMSYSDTANTVNSTYSFTGPGAPEDDEVTENACSVTDPHWSGHAFSEADLPQRFEDSSPAGGTALAYYVDGYDTSGWDALTPDAIDGWLDASGF